MIEEVVRYLHGAHVPFRLASYPSEEPEPHAAHRLAADAMLVDTSIFLIDGRPAIVCVPSGEQPSPAAIGAALGGLALEGSTADLADELRYATEPVPPLGQMFGVPLVLDERVAGSSVLVFRVFGESDFIEVPYADFARLEQPRLAPLASAGALGVGA